MLNITTYTDLLTCVTAAPRPPQRRQRCGHPACSPECGGRHTPGWQLLHDQRGPVSIAQPPPNKDPLNFDLSLSVISPTLCYHLNRPRPRRYVQLVNGVLTHVAVQPSPPASITYSQPQFQTQQVSTVTLSYPFLSIFLLTSPLL